MKKSLSKGITLISLVVTIIVLLILAGVAISMTLSDNGILNRAKQATDIHKEAYENELTTLGQANNKIDSYMNQSESGLELEDEEEKPELKPFITKWKTTQPNESIKLPLTEDGEYNFKVNYGDGNEYTIASYDDLNATHTYVEPGTYTVTIEGKMTDFSFKNIPDSKDKIVELVQWGNTQMLDIDFKDCLNLAGTIPVPTKGTFESLESVAGLFAGCSSLTGEIPAHLFYGADNVMYLSGVFSD